MFAFCLRFAFWCLRFACVLRFGVCVLIAFALCLFAFCLHFAFCLFAFCLRLRFYAFLRFAFAVLRLGCCVLAFCVAFCVLRFACVLPLRFGVCVLMGGINNADLRFAGGAFAFRGCAKLHKDQKGRVMHNKVFKTSPGVKQGDVLSTIIFNSVLEMVARRWKTQLKEHGLKLHTQHPVLSV